MDYFKKEKSKDDKIYYQNKITGETQWGHKTFFHLKKSLPRGWIRLDFKRQKPVYKYIGNTYRNSHLRILGGGGVGSSFIRPSSVISMPYKDLLNKEDTEGNYNSEVFRRFFLFEKVADLLKLTTESIGDESLQHLANQARVSPDEIIAYIEKKEHDDLQENARLTAFQQIRGTDDSFLSERSIRELCGLNMRETEFSKAMNQLDELLSCYINKTILKDPVICSNGHTYEREPIEQWLLYNNTCPKTRDRISNILIPNYVLRNVLDDFVKRYENQRGEIWEPIRDECVNYQNFMETVGRVNQVRTQVPTPEPQEPTFLSVEQLRSLASLPDIYIDPMLESWENMNRRYERFFVELYDPFGIRRAGSMFSSSGNRDRYERFISIIRGGEDRFVVLDGFDLRPGQQPLLLTREQEVQTQHIRSILGRSEREINGLY